MLDYSWNAGLNQWGRLEFNATFSIGFWNGLNYGNPGIELTMETKSYTNKFCLKKVLKGFYMLEGERRESG